MSRYIDADKLCEGLKHMAKYQEPYKQSTILGVVSTIENTPSADVVEVVRCKDCKHNDRCNQYVLHYGDECELAFCSYGERKEHEK